MGIIAQTRSGDKVSVFSDFGGDIPLVVVLGNNSGLPLEGDTLVNIDTTILVSGIPVGNYYILIEAEDESGNYSFNINSNYLRVVHNGVNTPICQENQTITLDPMGDLCAGAGNVSVGDLLGDNPPDCAGPIEYALYRESETTGEGFFPNLADTELTLDCADVGPLPVRIYAVDTLGDFSFCSINVEVAPGGGCLPAAPTPEVTCGELTTSSVTFTWLLEAAVGEYTYQANGGPIMTSTTGIVIVNDLAFGEEANITVFATPTNGCGQSSASATCAAVFPQTVDYSLTFPADITQDCGVFLPEDITIEVLQNLTCGSVPSASVFNIDTLDGGQEACFILAVTIDVINECEYDGSSAPIIISRDADQNDVDGDSPSIVHVFPGADTELLSDDEAFLDVDNDRTNPGTEIEGYASSAGRGYFRYEWRITVQDTTAPEITSNISDGNYSADPETCSGEVVFEFTATSNCFGDLASASALAFDFNAEDPNGDFMSNATEFVTDNLEEEAVILETGIGLDGEPVVRLLNAPPGYHALRITAGGICGPSTTVYYTFEVVDSDLVEPICVSNGTVMLQSIDGTCNNAAGSLSAGMLLTAPVTDCSLPLSYAVYTLEESPGANLDPIPGRTASFVCGDVGSQQVRLYAIDGAGNISFCQTNVMVVPADGVSCTGEVTLGNATPEAQCIVYAGFDLTVVNAELQNGDDDLDIGWFEDEAGLTPIADPLNYAPASAPTTVFARGNAGNCLSTIIPITFNATNAGTLTVAGLPDGLCSVGPVFQIPLPNEAISGNWRIEGEGPATSVDPVDRVGETLRLIFDADPQFCVAPFIHDLRIAAPPVAIFVDPGESVCLDSLVSFVFSGADAGSMNFFWSSDTDTGPMPGNTYAENFTWNTSGPAEVSLTVERYGCTSSPYTDQFEIEICEPCESILDCIPQQGQVGTVIISDSEGLTNADLCMAVTSDNFVDVVGFGFTIAWDTEDLTFSSIENINPAIIGLETVWLPLGPDVEGINIGAPESGQFTALYRSFAEQDDCTEANTFSLESGAELFQVCFTATNQQQNGDADVDFIDGPQSGVLLTQNNCTNPGEGTLAGFGGNMAFAVDCSDEDNIQFFLVSTSMPPNCGQDQNGVVEYNVQGMGPFSYLWSTGDTIAVLAGLSAGIYDLTVTDGNGCQDSIPLTYDLQPLMMICPEDEFYMIPANTDSIIVFVDAPVVDGCPLNDLSYSITGASLDQGIGPVGAFTFNLGVSEVSYMMGDSLCSFTITVEELEEDCAIFGVNLTSIIEPSCNAANGALNFDITGATGGPFEFTWSTGQAEFNPADLTAGVYTFDYTDVDSDCSFSVGFLLEESSPIELDCSSLDASASGAADGIAGVQVENASGFLSYFLINSSGDTVLNTQQLGNSFSGQVPPGDYVWRVEDSNGCEAECAFSIGFPACGEPIEGVIESESICQGDTYEWQGIMFIASGVYLDTIPSALGCDSIISLNLQVESTSDVQFTGDIIVCEGGEAVLSATGAASYSWRGEDDVYNGANVVLPPGVYELDAVTENGCTFFVQGFTVEEQDPPVIVLQSDTNPEICDGTETTISLSLQENETVTWTSGLDAIIVGEGADFVVGSIGTYNFAVEDTVTGCVSQSSITVGANTEVPFFNDCPDDIEVLLNHAVVNSVDVSFASPEASSPCGEDFDFGETTELVGLVQDSVVTFTATANGQTATCEVSISVLETDALTFYVDERRIRTEGVDTVWVPIGAVNFDQTAGFQLPFRASDMDGAGAILDMINPLHPMLENGLFTALLNEQTLNLTWLREDPTDESLSDSTLLFEVAIIVDGDPGACINFDFENTLPEVAQAFKNGQDVYPGTIGGEVCLPALADVAGVITRFNGFQNELTVPNIEVNLSGEEEPRQQVTSGDGSYFFPDLLRGQSYVVEPFYDGDHLNGISLLDVLLMRNMIIGLVNGSSPISPYQYLAANVSGGGCTISLTDLLLEMSILVGSRERFPSVNSHTFVDAKHEFPLLEDIRSNVDGWCACPDSIIQDPLKNDTLNNDFVAVKMGDISQNAADPLPIAGGTISFENVSFERGDTVTIFPNFSTGIVAADVSWSFNRNVLRPITGVEAWKDGYTNNEFLVMEGNVVHQVWADITEARELRFVASASGVLDQNLEVLPTSKGITEEAIIYSLEGLMSTSVKGAYSLTASPNPFLSEVQITIDTPFNGEVKIVAYNSAGQQVSTSLQSLRKGLNTVQLNGTEWPSGLYSLVVSGDGGTQSIKMVKQ